MKCIKSKYLLIFLISLLFACRREKESPNWDTQLLMPILKTSLGVAQILPDSVYTIGNDSSIFLSFNKNLDSIRLNVLDAFSIPAYKKSIGLTSITFPQNSIYRSITLGQLARQLANDPDTATSLTGVVILSNQGSSIKVEPRNNLSAGPYLIDANNIFTTANIKSGYLQIKVSNNLPVSLNEAKLQLANSSDLQNYLGNINFTNIQPGETQTQQIDLAGKFIEGNLTVQAPLLSVGGGQKVIIDTNAAVNIEITLHDIKISNATAIFPAQNLIEQEEETSISDLPFSLELKEVLLSSGSLKVQIFSTIKEKIYFSYQLPNARSSDNKPFEVSGFFEQSINSSQPSFEDEFNFSDFTLDLSGKPGHDTINTFYSKLTASVKESLIPVALSEHDSISIVVSMVNVKPKYVRGYFEKDTVISGTIPFNFFENFKGASLNFETMQTNLSVVNGIGFDFNLITESITSSNEKGESRSLIDENLINKSKNIASATNNPYTPQTTNIQTNTGADLLSIFPKEISYKFKLNAGSTEIPHPYNGFAFDNSFIKPSLAISIPLKFSGSGITLTDTILVTPEFTQNIKSGVINVIAYNGFPMKASLSMHFLNEDNVILDSLISIDKILPGIIDAASSKVLKKEMSKISYTFNEKTLINISQSEKIIFKTILETAPNNVAVKIFPDYTIDLKVVGDITYKVQ